MKKNMMINNQLTLGVGLKDEATFANYFAEKNPQLVAELKKSASGKGERFIYFSGAGGEGCTHLLQACCHAANLHHLRSVYLPLSNLSDFSPDIFEGLESMDLVCIDDMHRIAGNKEWEEAFFHAFNRMRDANTHLIVTANVMPKSLGLVLPDVVSRLVWGMVFQMQPLSDSEKLHVLIMRADRRGMTLSEEVGKFILTHCPRHMSTLFAALDALDKVSLAAQRKLTIPFVKTVLQI
jgi:DnaA family protein